MKTKSKILLTVLTGCLLLAALYAKANQSLTEKNMITEMLENGNTPELIKTLIEQMKDQLEKDEDNFPSLIRTLENLAAEKPGTANAAILHSMTAEMYNRYFQQNSWTINRRTPIIGYVPEDIREWTSNLFTDKIKEELTASLQPAELLQKTSSEAYKLIMETGKDSRELRPTLYDFLAYRAIDIQPTEELYQDLLKFRRSQPDKKALLLAELSHLRFVYNNELNVDNQQIYEEKLDSLLKVYADKDYSVEIIIDKADLLRYKTYQTGSPDSIKAIQYGLLKETISRFPRYDRIGQLENRLATMEESWIQTQNDNTVYPGKDLKIRLNYANVSRVKVSLYESLLPIEKTIQTYWSAEKEKTQGKLVKEMSFDLPLKNTFTPADTTISIPVDKPGLYEYRVSAENNYDMKTNGMFAVSRLAAVSRRMLSGQTEILVTDYLSGKPLKGAIVNYYDGSRNKLSLLGEVKTDADGIAVLPFNEKITAFQAQMTGDVSSFMTSIYVSRNTFGEPEEKTFVKLLTDRGLYRPGQTVYFKGIAYNNNKVNPSVVTGKKIEVVFRDANYQEISKQQLTSNTFGSISGEFTIPRQGLTGMLSISTDNGTVDFRVEEYKRPTFMVDLDSIKGEVAFGDEVTVRGKAQTFSGVALQSGDITWRIVRRPFWFRFYDGPYSHDQVAEGKTTVGTDGSFSFMFKPERGNDRFPMSFFTFDAIVSLTDSKGETQEGQTSFSVGDRSIVLTTNLPAQAEKERIDARVTARTLNGEVVSLQGSYTIYLLDEPKEREKPKEIKELDQGLFSTDKPIQNSVFVRLPSGNLRIKLTAKDSKGRTITQDQDFILYSKRDKRPPVFTHTWILQEKTICLPGEEAQFLFGTSDKDAYVLYELYNNGKIISRNRLTLSNENKTFKIPFLESYGDGLVASFTFVKEGKLYTTSVNITRKQPDRLLNFKAETFRDRLLPGSSESWKFRITGPDSLPVLAEVLAGMYDASLDRIYPFDWYFSPVGAPYIYYMSFSEGNGFNQWPGYTARRMDYKDIPDFSFDRLDWQGVMDAYRSRRSYGGGIVMKSQASTDMELAAAPPMADNGLLQESVVVGYGESQRSAVTGSVTKEDAEAGGASPAPQLRSNFSENAFFYPHLLTNKDGNVTINFTIPESNTTWKFQALAHTPDLKYGKISREVITQKKLMILPNLPRFMRQGDMVTISSQVMNLSDEDISGKVRLEFFNPENEAPINVPGQISMPFMLAKGSSTVMSWTVRAPEDIDLVGCRIIADSETVSDGEQHILPVLSNQILVTESTPFYLTGEGEKQIRISGDGGSSSTSRPYKMTLEFSNNPVWYAVQALPTVIQPDNDNVISWFAAYYTNTLAMSIAKSNPRIKSVIEQWKAQGHGEGSASTLLSSLEKNEELKNILLSETPWVMDAQTESEQKERLELLFDVNRATRQREEAMRVLLEQQTAEGGWGWFKGLYASRSITQFILNGMSQLVRLSAVQYNSQEKEMQMNALRFLDKSMQSDYESLARTKADKNNYVPTQDQLDFLYVRSYYRDIPEWGDAREGIRFYTNQAEKQWQKASLLGKGETALLMHRNGKKEVAAQILAWLKKTATTSNEMGMYWANNRRANNYFVSPVDVHCLLMTAFQELGTNTKEVDLMKQWLLNQKRTQNWESVPTTVNAVYGILYTGTDWLKEQNKAVISWGDKIYDTSASGETATGYIKEVVSANDITPSMRNTLTIKKEGKAPAWGAVYNQYFESIDKVNKQKGVLSVDKKLFIETNSGTQRQITPVTAERPLKLGDKVIVRLTIRTDREMEYVSLKDLRAGCFEPNIQLSGSTYSDGLRYYRSPKDLSENFYFDRLPTGTYVIVYSAFVSRTGEYSGGIATIQCQYAPEFVSHTEGEKLIVND